MNPFSDQFYGSNMWLEEKNSALSEYLAALRLSEFAVTKKETTSRWFSNLHNVGNVYHWPLLYLTIKGIVPRKLILAKLDIL